MFQWNIGNTEFSCGVKLDQVTVNEVNADNEVSFTIGKVNVFLHRSLLFIGIRTRVWCNSRAPTLFSLRDPLR